jgi:hypothetical protein
MTPRARIVQIRVSSGGVPKRPVEGSLTSGDPVRLLAEDKASSLLGAR